MNYEQEKADGSQFDYKTEKKYEETKTTFNMSIGKPPLLKQSIKAHSKGLAASAATNLQENEEEEEEQFDRNLLFVPMPTPKKNFAPLSL